MRRLRIRTKLPWISYPGSTIQQNYSEDVVHGYLLWSIKNKTDYDVKFCELPNPCPYVTIDWKDDVTNTISYIKNTFLPGSRFRIYSKNPLLQRDIIDVMTFLKEVMHASEITFKTDHQINNNVVNAGTSIVTKEDLRNFDVLIKMLKEYYDKIKVPENVWIDVYDLVKKYLSVINVDEIDRNIKWSLRHLKFDNTLAYGEDNVINFETMNGIVGIFGPNRSGKSSIVGTIMYALFNGTDRGSVKNLHVINARKMYCSSRAVINVNAIDYVIERQTVKNENKRGQFNATTALNIFRIDNGKAIDLVGEQRVDSEKVIRRLIGNPDDFLLTSLSAQDEIKLFITLGASSRRKILSRFLNLDIFDEMHVEAKDDLKTIKAVIKSLPDSDWSLISNQYHLQIKDYDEQITEKNNDYVEAQERLDIIRHALRIHQNFTPVTKDQVDVQQLRVAILDKQVNQLVKYIEVINNDVLELSTRIDKIIDLQKNHNILEYKERIEAFRAMESSVVSLKNLYEKEISMLKQQERSLKILDDVPCDDQFPSCKFIKDAYFLKDKIEPQREKISQILEKLNVADESLTVIKRENLIGKIAEVERLNELHSKLKVEISIKQIDLIKSEAILESSTSNLNSARIKLEELYEALKNEENAEVVSIKMEIDSIQGLMKRLDVEKMAVASERGKVQNIFDKCIIERNKREEMLQKLKAHELIATAFSRKGIPSIITSSQLPIINAEIAKILHGIVDFMIELETEDDSDSMEIYINYGDSRRFIELGSGMEKMIASIAIRVALIVVSSLPKTDMFIIDEGFGALDDAGVEACNRLLVSLKRYFKTVIVITHVEGIKDSTDMIVEVTKNEKDAKVAWN